ncbi:MAG: hypothetical protein QOH42_1945 [Blastocatellia bacterium]|nr:hypothetical protein [Blastocatellia bacterium]
MESVPGAVAPGSQLAHDPGSRSRDPVATAPGTDLILKLRHYLPSRKFAAILRAQYTTASSSNALNIRLHVRKAHLWNER